MIIWLNWSGLNLKCSKRYKMIEKAPVIGEKGHHINIWGLLLNPLNYEHTLVNSLLNKKTILPLSKHAKHQIKPGNSRQYNVNIFGICTVFLETTNRNRTTAVERLNMVTMFKSTELKTALQHIFRYDNKKGSRLMLLYRLYCTIARSYSHSVLHLTGGLKRHPCRKSSNVYLWATGMHKLTSHTHLKGF